MRTDETFTSYLDENSNRSRATTAVSTVDYTVVQVDGEWLIDETFVE